jgi:energy-coupling factor transport system ATP-binding protein
MPLVAKGLVHAYPGASAPVLNGLSLDLVPGRVLALCGAARTGRSTALALLAGLSAPRDGSVLVDGIRADAPEARGRVGLLLQNADEALFGLTVHEDVMFAPQQLGLPPDEARARADDALRAVHLEPETFARRSPFSLSGGQRRRAAIAGVMAMNPTYLLLDEPFAGLDPQGRGETVKVIRGLATQGFGQHTGILVALTDLDLALQLADALLILHGGRAAWQGTVAEYVAHPPAVEQWGLHQPVLVALARRLRETGWCLRLDDPSPEALSRAIAAHMGVVRR